MFDFDQWSEKVFQTVELLNQSNGDEHKIHAYREKLRAYWAEMMEHDQDDAVNFLTHLLAIAKDSVEGRLTDDDLEKLVGGLRENLF